jgi:hypothetical protein
MSEATFIFTIILIYFVILGLSLDVIVRRYYSLASAGNLHLRLNTLRQ